MRPSPEFIPTIQGTSYKALSFHGFLVRKASATAVGSMTTENDIVGSESQTYNTPKTEELEFLSTKYKKLYHGI